MFLINLFNAFVFCAYGGHNNHNTHQIGYQRVDKDNKEQNDIFEQTFEYHSFPLDTVNTQMKQHGFTQNLTQSGHEIHPQRPVGFETQQIGFHNLSDIVNGTNVNTPMHQGIALQNGMDPKKNIHAGKRTEPLLNGQKVRANKRRENTNGMRSPFGQSTSLFGFQGDSDDYDD